LASVRLRKIDKNKDEHFSQRNMNSRNVTAVYALCWLTIMPTTDFSYLLTVT